MLMRLVGAALVMSLAGCNGADAGAEGTAEEREEARPSRFEVSVDTQRIATPDAEVPPSENPDN
jgi:hypothetical protein